MAYCVYGHVPLCLLIILYHVYMCVLTLSVNCVSRVRKYDFSKFRNIWEVEDIAYSKLKQVQRLHTKR